MALHELPTKMARDCTDGLFYCFSNWAGDVTFGAFWIFALLAFCFALFMATMRFGATKAFGFASFVGLLGGVFLAVLKLIPWWIASTFIIIGVIGLAVMFLSER